MSPSSRRPSLAWLPLATALVLLGGCGSAGQPPAPPLPPLQKATPFTTADAAFMQKLDEMDATEIALAKIAATRAARSDIATLSATILKDHTDNQEQLSKLAAVHGITLAAKPSSEDEKLIGRMARLRGPAFDRNYVRQLKRDHARMKPVLQGEIAGSKNADLVSLARKTETMLASHETAF
jgi:putative membrane protein